MTSYQADNECGLVNCSLLIINFIEHGCNIIAMQISNKGLICKQLMIISLLSRIPSSQEYCTGSRLCIVKFKKAGRDKSEWFN